MSSEALLQRLQHILSALLQGVEVLYGELSPHVYLLSIAERHADLI